VYVGRFTDPPIPPAGPFPWPASRKDQLPTSIWNPSQRAMLNLKLIQICLTSILGCRSIAYKIHGGLICLDVILCNKDRMGFKWHCAQIAGVPRLLKSEMVQNPVYVSL
jgi:hypothetical protein